jgi:hypothetical protein
MVWTKTLLKTGLVSALAGGLMFFGSVTNARAYDRADCRRDVQNWEQRLDRDVYRHGYNSRQANHDRHELREARQSCQRRFGNSWRIHFYRDYDRD